MPYATPPVASSFSAQRCSSCGCRCCCCLVAPPPSGRGQPFYCPTRPFYQVLPHTATTLWRKRTSSARTLRRPTAQIVAPGGLFNYGSPGTNVSVANLTQDYLSAKQPQPKPFSGLAPCVAPTCGLTERRVGVGHGAESQPRTRAAEVSSNSAIQDVLAVGNRIAKGCFRIR